VFVTLMGAVLLMMFMVTVRTARSHARGFTIESSEARTTRPSRHRSTQAPLESEVDRFVARVLRTARDAAAKNRPPELRRLDTSSLQVPKDFDAYRQIVRPLAEAPVFVRGQADKLEHYGRPALLNAIALLQELDYGDGRDCRMAANVHRFLAQVTTLDELCVEVVGGVPSASEICRFHAVADGWRRFAETFAKDDDALDRLLRARGKIRGDR
jgi:hypothetical protein